MTTPDTTEQDAGLDAISLKLLSQLSVGPSLADAAGALLSESLAEQYPDLHIDPHTTLLGEPIWELEDDKIIALPPLYTSLSSLLAAQASRIFATRCLEGEHFLTRLPLTEPAVYLPVRILEVAHTLNMLAPVVYRAYRELAVDFWNDSSGNGPHWHALASTLREAWNVQEVDGWTDENCKLARSLYYSPDTSNRQPGDTLQPGACLIDIDLVNDGKVVHTQPLFIAVLISQSEDETVILCHSFYGYAKFTSMGELNEYLRTFLEEQPLRYERLQWRLHQPAGNYFEYLACILISLQILSDSTVRPSAPGVTPLSAVAGTGGQVTAQGPDLAWYQRALPDWLVQASESERGAYSQHLKDLAALNSLNAGKSYQDDIPSIQDYARTTLKAQIIKDHPEAAHMALDTLTLRVKSPVVWGVFPVPGQYETYEFSLVDLALQNLIALPIGQKSLQMRASKPLPAWLTTDYVEQLVTQVDIGTTYPALISSKLLDDPAESARRKTLYAQHLRVQLPLLALQYKIRRENGIDERGYRFVAAALQDDVADRTVLGQAIVIMPLAFAPKRQWSTAVDVVANMYVIGPQNSPDSPCLLYRPLFEPALIQYSSQANLMYGIVQSKTLRDSVLAWLPDSVREDYSNYVFPGDLPAPWIMDDLVVVSSKLWAFSGPMHLGQQAINGDQFATLFDANAQALVELADRASVSNAEARWATLKHAGWLIFNAVLPFMGRYASAAAWIWQIVDQVHAIVEAHEHGQKQAQWAALTDVLLSVGMAITLHVASRARPGAIPAERVPGTPVVFDEKAIIVEQLPAPATDLVASGLELPLNIGGAINRSQKNLTTILDSFTVEKPADLPDAISAEGIYQHLHLLEQHYYAPVGTRWFEVALEGDATIVIVDSEQPSRKGPALIHNAKGEWFIDSRLRLRGGGRKSEIKSVMDKAKATSEKLRTHLAAFEKAKKGAQEDLQAAHLAMTAAPSTSEQAKKRLVYLNKLDSQGSDYEEARKQLMTLNVFTPATDFKQKALGYLKAQLELNEAGIRELQTTFTPTLKTVLDQLESPAQSSTQAVSSADAQAMIDMSDDMIKRLDYARSRFTELRALAKDGLRMIQDSKPRLPAYTGDDLRALQVTLARNLCVTPQSISTESNAWAQINEIVDRADLTVQTLRDTLQERHESRLDECVETLHNLLDQFQLINERLLDFPADFPDQSITPPIEILRAQLREFAERATAELAPLHVEQEQRRIRPTPPPTPPRPRKKFIHTRFNGVLIGEPRLTAVGLETDLVDIKSPLTQHIIATFHERTPGVWVERVEHDTTRPSPKAPDLATSLLNGRTLLDELRVFQIRADEQIGKPSRTPIGIEHMLHQHARLLEQAAQDIEEALTQTNATESQQPSASTLGKQLNDAAQALYRQANEQVQKLIKQQPPTLSGVEWLINHKLISIKKTAKRRRLKSATKDYLDEYTLIDDAGTPLWYAHFHYSTADARADRFLSARLKTPEERALGQAADDLQGLNAEQRVAFYRSTLNLTQARRFFFRTKPD
ncbi:DUF6543 domain-containing protein [Pseudomonas sp.]|uniref:DUF6543 domain-containing protein n=1 Tax=Pseudomonas sp. TaxID=306 RepID=UPI002618C953|nr:DUF6543 domain-containing protein [Pseudomonas sp.]